MYGIYSTTSKLNNSEAVRFAVTSEMMLAKRIKIDGKGLSAIFVSNHG
ncbi:17077_t:CDS:2 [Racocetra fulgida]|uniref:17077_t:CDS:1 n=1 Tax=Racocetra fulgida TaxID=60492 RepID=A0A9N9CY26_9GLOM|nr:17077_t:CDS:2 [Racocetra fulgida]